MTTASSSARLRIDTSRPSAGVVRVAVAGEIDLATTDELHAALSGVLPAQLPRRMEVDFAGVSFMDCTGLTVLLRARRATMRLGGELRISDVQPIVGRLLELTGLFGVLTAAFVPTPLVAAASASPSPMGPPRQP